jgi:peptide/nickel transport system permease protein
MIVYILRRLTAMIPTLILISIITFIIIQFPPGDFFTTLQAEIAETGGGRTKRQLSSYKKFMVWISPCMFSIFDGLPDFPAWILAIP